MTHAYETKRIRGFSLSTLSPQPQAHLPQQNLYQYAKPQELLEAFAEAKKRRDLPRLRQICKDLELGWSQVPVWQRGHNRLSYQHQRLSPCMKFLPSHQEPYYQAFLQAVLDPEFRQLISEELSQGAN